MKNYCTCHVWHIYAFKEINTFCECCTCVHVHVCTFSRFVTKGNWWGGGACITSSLNKNNISGIEGVLFPTTENQSLLLQTSFLLWSTYMYMYMYTMYITLYTVKSVKAVYKGHSRKTNKLATVDRWLSETGSTTHITFTRETKHLAIKTSFNTKNIRARKIKIMYVLYMYNVVINSSILLCYKQFSPSQKGCECY